MHENHKLAIPEQKTDAEIALAIHYLDPEFNDERTGEDAATILRICVTFLTWLTAALTYICLSMRTLENANAAGDSQRAWRTFSWMRTTNKADITSAETTIAIRYIGPHAATTPR